MPVWKYRSIEDMPAPWTVNRHVPLGTRIRTMLSMTPIAGPLGLPRGVARFRSIDELNADRRRYESERIQRIRDKHSRTD
jgi:hypothetical protein